MVKIRGEATQKLDTNILPSFLDFFCGQFSNQSGNLDVNQQLQMALEERASLETQIAQVRCCIKYIDDPIPDFCKETCVAEERSLSFVLFFSSFILYAVSHLIYSADNNFLCVLLCTAFGVTSPAPDRKRSVCRETEGRGEHLAAASTAAR